MKPFIQMAVAVLIGEFALNCAADVIPPEDLPRYHFQVGQELMFSGDRSDEQTGEGAFSGEHHTVAKVAVIAANPDASFHVVAVIDSTGTFHQGTMSCPYERIVEACECDVSPDGTLHGDDDPIVGLSRIFPRLPANNQQLQNGWDDQTIDHSRILHYAPAKAAAGDSDLEFCSVPTGGVQAVFEPGTTLTYRWNRQIGAVDAFDLKTPTSGAGYSEHGSTRRTDIRQLDAKSVAKLASVAAAYQQALAAYRAAVTPKGSSEPAIDFLRSAQKHLQSASDDFVAGVLNDGGAGSASAANAACAMAPDPPSDKDLPNTPAPDWTASDLAGKPHSLKDFRGKVVLLDFGSRRCPWCIREMPQLIQLSQEFRDQPVAIIGMDGDTDPADLKFVVDAMGPPYLTLMASEAYKGYPVEGTPTVVIIDQNGIMRRRLVGYSSTGCDEMRGAIQTLLLTQAKAH